MTSSERRTDGARRGPGAAQGAVAGFTMIELLLVAGLLSMLLGLGIGFLKRGDGLPEALSTIAAQLRAAAVDARTHGLPTEVVLTQPSEPGLQPTVVAHGLDPLVLVSFDPAQRMLDGRLSPVYGGLEVPGRIGVARAPNEASKDPLLRMSLGPSLADLRGGFACQVDVLLRARTACSVLRLGACIEVELDDDAVPHVRLAAVGAQGLGSGDAVNLRPKNSLPVGRWCTFEFGADGRDAWCAVDGRVLDRASFRGRLNQQETDTLLIGGGDVPFPGAVDELQLLAYVTTAEQSLPAGIELDQPVRIAFDRAGEPIAPPEILLLVAESGGAPPRREKIVVGPGGILQ